MWCYMLRLLLHQYLFAFPTPPSMTKRLLKVFLHFKDDSEPNSHSKWESTPLSCIYLQSVNVVHITALHCIEATQWNGCWRPSSNTDLAHTEWLEQIKSSFMVSEDPLGIVSLILLLWKYLNFSPWISRIHTVIISCVRGTFWCSTAASCRDPSPSYLHLLGAWPPLSLCLERRHPSG